MRWPLGRSTLVLLALALATGGAAASGSSTSPSLVERFLSSPDAAASSYRALRHLEAENDHFHSSAWMDVWTEADPTRGFGYEIAGEGGSDLIRSRVFRATLDAERRMWENGGAERAAITPANYTFEEGPAGDDGMPSIVLRPRRKDVLLVDGFIVVNGDDGELVRMEGLLSKTPSFWTRRVHVTRYYHRLGGVRMPVALETVATLRLAGRSTFRMSYEYERVNGVHVGSPLPRGAHP